MDIDPISPDEVINAKAKAIPKEVIAVFNELIAIKWNGKVSTISQRLVIEKIREVLPIKDFNLDWLNVEEIYNSTKRMRIKDILRGINGAILVNDSILRGAKSGH